MDMNKSTKEEFEKTTDTKNPEEQLNVELTDDEIEKCSGGLIPIGDFHAANKKNPTYL